MINCMVVDDEPLAIEILSDYVRKIPSLNLLGTFTNSLTALEQIQEQRPALLFLDIRMRDISGIELLQGLSYKPAVIFTTAFQEYALDGYQMDVVDYLLKPIAFPRFTQAVAKAKARIVPVSTPAPAAPRDFIFIKAEYKTVKLNLDDIIFIEGLKDYTRIYLKDQQKPLLTLQNLKSFESKLPADLFIRIHRSYMVAVSKISSISRNRILAGSHEIPISTGFKENIQHIINGNS